MNVEKMFEGEGGYVFVSHSHLDLKEVRQVRNFLETNGIEPILFYLRSMEGCDEERLELLRKLIYEEIDSREFFLYLDSDNAKKSQWVQEEIRYVSETAPEKLIVLPLASGIEETEKRLKKLLRRMRVFISYSRVDTPLVERLQKVLVERDFRVYTNENTMTANDSWAKQMKKTINDIAKEGSVIVLLTERSIRSQYVKRELLYALKRKAMVLPVIVGDINLTDSGLEFLKTHTHFHLQDVNSEEELVELAEGLKGLLNRKD